MLIDLYHILLCLSLSVIDVILNLFDSVIIKNGHIDLDGMNIKGPTSTKTYLVHDGTELQSFFGGAGSIGAAAFAAPLFFLSLMAERFRNAKEK